MENFDCLQILNIWSSAIALALVLSGLLIFLLNWKPVRDFLGFEDNEDDDDDDHRGGGMLQSLDLACARK